LIREIRAKSLLVSCKNPESWFGVKYNMNVYRGCEHQCIYCDSRSECYGIENFNDVLVKINAVELLRSELASKRIKGTVGTGAMSDPYTFAESKYNLTGETLKVIAEFGFPVHITTKSDMILKDVETLQEINRVYASVSFTLTTCDDELAGKLEPLAPSPTHRLTAMRKLSGLGICTGINLMPVLPFIEDNIHNITGIVEKAAESGASYIVAWFGMTLRDRQRAYYYEKLDKLFPGMKQKYLDKFKNSYSCTIENEAKIRIVFEEACKKHGISTVMPSYDKAVPVEQLTLFDS